MENHREVKWELAQKCGGKPVSQGDLSTQCFSPGGGSCEHRGLSRHVLGMAVEMKRGRRHRSKSSFLWLSANSQWTVRSSDILSAPAKAEMMGGRFYRLSVSRQPCLFDFPQGGNECSYCQTWQLHLVFSDWCAGDRAHVYEATGCHPSLSRFG